MKQIKETAIVKLTDNLHLFIEGIYTPEEPGVLYPVDSAHPGSPSEFYIENINIEEGTIMDLLEWADEILSKECNILRESMNRGTFYRNDSIWFYLEESCIKQIENEQINK